MVIGAGRLAGRRAGESKSLGICNLRKIKGLFVCEYLVCLLVEVILLELMGHVS